MTATTTLATTLDVEEARRLTERIKLTANTARESFIRLQGLVDKAKTGEAHVVLGYASWTAYLADVLGDEPMRLTSAERHDWVGYLAGEGMSTRAIAPIVGTSRETVRLDLSGDKKLSPDPESAPGVPTWDEWRAGERPEGWEPEPAAPVRPPAQSSRLAAIREGHAIRGMDGKTYTRAEPRKQKRSPLPDAYWKTVHQLIKDVERLERLTADDRFKTNRATIQEREGNRLAHAAETLTAVRDALNGTAE